jgi:hypothetical protein
MHGKNIGMGYPVMGMNEIEIPAGNGGIGKKSETYCGQESWESDHGNKMKGNIA